MKMKTAIIFGTNGQDGSYLSELLIDKGYEVIGIVRRSSTNTLERLVHVIDHPNFNICEGDVVDPSSVNYLINKYQPDELYNLSSQSHVQTSFEQPFYTFQVNAVGVLNILEGVRNYSPKTKVYQASTSELFGSNYDIDDDGNKYQDENTKFSPNSPYAVAKLAAHELVRLYKDAYGIFACAGILFNHESPRRGENFVTRKITKWLASFHTKTDKARQNFPILKLGNLDAVRDWSHAKDMVEGMWLMLQQDKPKDYVLCSGVGYSVRDFLDKSFNFIEINDWSNYVEIDPKFYRPCEVEFLQGKCDLAKKELGWKPKISFNKLVGDMVHSYISSRFLCG